MTDIILVHGAFHGGWCWRDSAELLRRAGHRVFTPTLTGLGERSHLMSADIGLETHAKDIENVIKWEDVKEGVLVSHSYGGMPMIMAADRAAKRLSALVFLDSHVPNDGEDMATLRSAAMGEPVPTIPEDILVVPPPQSAHFGLKGDLLAWADEKMTPHPVATFIQPVSLSGAWKNIPNKVFVRLSKYPAPYFDVYYERCKADADWTVVRHDEHHDYFITDPQWFVKLLNETVL